DLDRARALDDVVVRDDVAGLVDHEARAEGLLGLGRRSAERIEERIRLLLHDRRRRHLDDTGRRALVDPVNRERAAVRADARLLGWRVDVDDLPNGVRLRREPAERGHDTDRESGAGNRRAGQPEKRGARHLHWLPSTEAALSTRSRVLAFV